MWGVLDCRGAGHKGQRWQSELPKIPGIPHLRAVRALEKAGFKINRGDNHCTRSYYAGGAGVDSVEVLPVNAFTIVGGKVTVGWDTLASGFTADLALRFTAGTKVFMSNPTLIGIGINGSVKCAFQKQNKLRLVLIYPAEIKRSARMIILGRAVRLEP